MSESQHPAKSESIPLFPLGTVLYPGGVLPLRIFEPRYLDMVGEALRNERPFGIVPIRHGQEVGVTPHFFDEGTLATIRSWDRGADGLLYIRVEGGRMFRVVHHEIRADLLLLGGVEWLDEPGDRAIPEHLRYLSALLEEIFKHNAEQVPYTEWRMDSALWVAYRLAEVLPMAVADKHAILREADAEAKLARLDRYLSSIRQAPPEGPRH